MKPGCHKQTHIIDRYAMFTHTHTHTHTPVKITMGNGLKKSIIDTSEMMV